MQIINELFWKERQSSLFENTIPQVAGKLSLLEVFQTPSGGIEGN